jgi:ABC-type lipoprotein release transport system permease subunit
MTTPTDQGRALAPLVRLAWRSGRDWRDAALLVVAVALPIGLGALVGPLGFGADILSIVALVVLAATVALSVGAVLAVSTKRRLLRYGRVAAIGADPTQLRVLLVVESLAPAALGFVLGTVVGTLISLAVGPLRFILDDNPGDTRLLVTVVAINLAGLLVVTVIGLWLAAAPAAAMALKAPAESLAARAP